jgi:ATP-binding cassette subfamily B protein
MATRVPEPFTAGEPAGNPSARGMVKLRPLLLLQGYVVRYRVWVVLALVALIVSAAATLVLPVAVRRVIDFGFSGQDRTFIDRYFAVLMLIGSVLAAASAARYYCVNWLGERIVADLRIDVFRHLARLGPAFYETTHSAEVMSRLTADTTQIKAAAGASVSQALRNLIMLAGSLAMMLVTSLELSLLVLLAIPAIVLPLVAYGRVVRRLSRRAQDTLAEAAAYAAENLAAVRTMQAFTSEALVADRFAASVERAFDTARQRLRARAFLTGAALFLVFASIAGVLWFAAGSVVAGEMTAGRLSQFVLYAVLAGSALAGLSEIWGELSQAAGASERLAELLSLKPSVRVPVSPQPLPEPARGEIAFCDVRFAYPGGRGASALDGVTFHVAPGELVALVGPSGAGKSTIFNLLLRFFDPQDGRILVDGVPIDEVDPVALRSRISLVPQDAAIFADDVLENIRYGRPDASVDDVVKAAVAAQADSFIRALPEGYGTRLGERGVRLSGGQRQRIAIARALLRNAPILLLDEATSALDAESEVLVRKAVEEIMRGRTTLVIAHRLATIRKADRIIVLDHGRIVEQGTHAELLQSGGLYGRLADLQLADEPHPPPASVRLVTGS